MKTNNPYNGLERLFHEPKRLAITSHLCAAPQGASFTELKEACNLTDGNLNRHLKTLETGKAIAIIKKSETTKPYTKIILTPSGRNSFLTYLQSLENALMLAVEALEPDLATRSSLVYSEYFLNRPA